MPNIGVPELIILLVIVLLVVGPKKLPAVGRSLGSGMREFKDSVTGSSKDDDDDAPRLAQPPVAQAPVVQPIQPAVQPVARPVQPEATPQPVQPQPPAPGSTPADPAAPQAPPHSGQ